MTSWRTTLGGTLAATGTALSGAAIATDWMTPTEKHVALLIGFVLMIAGQFIHGLFARDNNVSSEDAGIK